MTTNQTIDNVDNTETTVQTSTVLTPENTGLPAHLLTLGLFERCFVTADDLGTMKLYKFREKCKALGTLLDCSYKARYSSHDQNHLITRLPPRTHMVTNRDYAISSMAVGDAIRVQQEHEDNETALRMWVGRKSDQFGFDLVVNRVKEENGGGWLIRRTA